jgi:non-specific serine/threonine protein kinase/serine/threonine-protein kinase
MTPERWQQVKRVCELALEREPEARAAFLTEVCAADTELRAQVESLLQHASADVDVAGSPIWGPVRPGAPATSPAAPDLPHAIGRYRIVRILGEGGMGTVYEAEQDSPRRRVALKVVRSGLSTREMLKRFERESQVLGRLQHPGIAQIYEAGTADVGPASQPYFAMEFIQGAPLREYAAAHHLDLAARLELVAKICDAVQHAHDRGIIHRDIKPGNVLVDRTGQPKVLDFGVARLLEAQPAETLRTSEGQLVGTLAYMSPEQVLGDSSAIDGRSDVYAIGVVLYELLAGRMPYDVAGLQHEAVQAILEDDPHPLSAANRQLKGDVETIVSKALEKDRARRYPSPAALAGDLRRYLINEPITARPASAAYQLQKFVRRHTSLVAAAAAVFVALTAGTVVSTWQALRAGAAGRAAVEAGNRAERERDDAVRERNRALTAEDAARQDRNRAVAAQEQAQAERSRAIEAGDRATTEAAISQAVRDFLQTDLLAQSSAQQQATPDSKPDPDLKVRTALDRAAARVPTRFHDQPVVEASVRQTIGAAYQDLGLYPQAQEQFERALQLRRSAGDAQAERILDTLRSLALNAMELGKYPEAERLYVEAIDGLQRRHGPDDAAVLETQAGLVEVYLQQGRYEPAEALILKTVATQRRVLGADHPSTLASLSELGRAQTARGKYADAEASLRTLSAGLQRTKGPDHPDTLSVASDLGEALEFELKYDDAEQVYTTALERERRVLGADHPYTLTTANNLAVLYKKRGKFAQAEPLYLAVVDGRTRKLGAEHPDTLSAMNNLGALYVSQKRYTDAESLLTRVLATRQRVLGPEHPNTLNTMVNLAQAYRGLGRFTDTESLYADVLSIRRRVLGNEHPDTLFIMANLGVMYTAEAKLDEAERLNTEALEIRRRTLGNGHPTTAGVMDNLGVVYLARGDAARAESLFAEALEARRRAVGPDHQDTLHTQVNLGEAFVAAGDLERGRQLIEETLTRAREVLGPNHDVTLMAAESTALVRRRQGRLADARTMLAEALASRQRLLGPRHPYTIEDVVNLGLVMLEQHDYAEAEAMVRPVASASGPAAEPWLEYEALSVLGGALTGLGRLTDAEAPLLKAHDGLVALGPRIPAQDKPMLSQTIDRLVALYRALGNDERAAFWASRQSIR